MDPYATVQTIERNTYDLNENLYLRVVGPYNLETPFTLEVTVQGGICGAVQPVPNGTPVTSGLTFPSGSFQTVILTDSDRLHGDEDDVSAALADLEALSRKAMSPMVMNRMVGNPMAASLRVKNLKAASRKVRNQKADSRLGANQREVNPKVENQMAKSQKAMNRKAVSRMGGRLHPALGSLTDRRSQG